MFVLFDVECDEDFFVYIVCGNVCVVCENFFDFIMVCMYDFNLSWLFFIDVKCSGFFCLWCEMMIIIIMMVCVSDCCVWKG